ncbi:large ribosomal subunit protein mL66-like [Crassostrea virginica]|uniref:28S ribosomal protein S18a, mitochondrial-like n=1 Tax=Crassostrea virginica TaxID=6565 RepID=A0A8B8DHG5_CRAVI|nr:28S ribosomal protein S18a, mitochondrial-like [Crassostrea virginica]
MARLLTNIFQKSLIRQFSTSQSVFAIKVKETKTAKDVTVVEGERVESPWKNNVLKSDELKNEACPICRLNLDIKYTDVLILHQFLTDKGRLLPRRATGVCLKSQRKLQEAIHKAQRAGLMPQLRPASRRERVFPIANFKWKRFPSYYDD